MTTVGQKVAYVKSQPQTREHHCHWPGCRKQVPPAVWGCGTHWFKLPKALRNRIWKAYRPGQENDLTPSVEYLAVAREAQEWIAAYEQTQGNFFEDEAGVRAGLPLAASGEG